MRDESFHGTTIIGVRRNGKIALGGDGQVTLGDTVVKTSAVKIRRLYNDTILAGFAGATADAFSLFEKWNSFFSCVNGTYKKTKDNGYTDH